MNKLLVAIAAIALVTPAIAQEETTMKLTDAPKAAMDAAMANANGVTFATVQMDGEEYEFGGTMASGMMLEVDVLADGTVMEIEEQIAVETLPAEVAAALAANLAGFVPTFVEKSTRDGGVVVYEFEGTVDGKEIDAEINADGTNFKMNDDAAA